MTILLVEDNPGDVGLIRIALRDSRVPTRLLMARDGEEALQFLHGEGSFLADSGAPSGSRVRRPMPLIGHGSEPLAVVERLAASRTIGYERHQIPQKPLARDAFSAP
jgi:hypothetical protein